MLFSDHQLCIPINPFMSIHLVTLFRIHQCNLSIKMILSSTYIEIGITDTSVSNLPIPFIKNFLFYPSTFFKHRSCTSACYMTITFYRNISAFIFAVTDEPVL